MRRSKDFPQGEVHRISFASTVLMNNPLHDDHVRDLFVYTPANFKPGAPLLVDLPGFNSAGPDHVTRKNIGENVPERLDRLIAQGLMPPTVVAFPDCMTALGGNQYVNSAGTGRYSDYVADEIVPFVEQNFRCGGAGRRGIFGKSSGGFGALWHALERPDFWSAVACNSGDMGFETTYKPGIYAALDVLARHEYSIEAFFTYFDSADKVTPAEKSCRMHLALAATYDPDPTAYRNVRLPCDMKTARFYPDRWRNWLRYDPILRVNRHAGALARLKTLWIDCGSRDQYFLHFGARRLSQALSLREVPHVYEEFNDEHLDVDYRMDKFLPCLAKALTS